MLERTHRNVWLLVACMGTVQTLSTAQVTMAALIGHSLANDKALATLPVAIWMAGSLASSLPAALIFRRFGRKAGFVAGTLAMILGCLGMAAGVWAADFVLYCASALPYGLGFGISQHYRFAAAEVAPPSFRSRAVSYVMLGGVVAALAGPELVRLTKDWVVPVLFLGSYVALALLLLLPLVLLSTVDLPPPPSASAGSGRTVGEILAGRRFIAAAGAAAAAYGAMNLIMTSTPLEMILCGFSINDSARIIQYHALAMFAPSFFTGALIARFGHARMIACGAGLILAASLAGVSGSGFAHFAVGLVLLGLGWNFMFITGSALQAEGWSDAERAKAQALNDLIVFSTVTATAFGSGAVHATLGWAAVNVGMLPIVLGAAMAVPVLLGVRGRRVSRTILR